MKSEFALPWKRYALIVELADRLQGVSPQVGKTVLQKMIYLLQEVYGMEFLYGFTLYNYGPFAPEILTDLDFVSLLGGVAISTPKDKIGCEIKPIQNEKVRVEAREFLSKTKSILRKAVEEFGEFSAKDLELRSTIVYIDRDSKRSQKVLTNDEIIDLTREIKPHFSREEIGSALRELENRKYLVAIA